MNDLTYDQLVLDSAVRQKACAFLHSLGRGFLVDMQELEVLLAHTDTLADVVEIINLFDSTAPLLQHAMVVQNPDGRRRLVRMLNLGCNYEFERTGDSATISKLVFTFVLFHPTFTQPIGMSRVVFNRHGTEMVAFGSSLSDINDSSNAIDETIFDEKVRTRLAQAYAFIGETVYRVAEALPFAKDTVADGMRSQIMERTLFVDVLNFMLSTDLLDPLGKLFKLADATLDKKEDGLAAAFAALRKSRGRIISGYDVVSLFDGRRDELTLPRLLCRRGHESGELDTCSLHVALARVNNQPIDTVHLLADNRGRMVLSHALVELRSDSPGDTQPSQIKPTGEEYMVQLEQNFPAEVMQTQRDTLVRALKGFYPYTKGRNEVEDLRRDVLRRLISPARAG